MFLITMELHHGTNIVSRQETDVFDTCRMPVLPYVQNASLTICAECQFNHMCRMPVLPYVQNASFTICAECQFNHVCRMPVLPYVQNASLIICAECSLTIPVLPYVHMIQCKKCFELFHKEYCISVNSWNQRGNN